jgi:SNF2 family DNA or RNA helicase
LGLNITSAIRVILFDLAWNPVHDQQAVGRAYRLGQKKHVFVYRLGTFGTYEDIFFNENVFKLNLSKRVIDKHNPGRFGMHRDKDIAKYFKPLKDDDAAEPFDDALFEGKDSVLDQLISYSKSGKGPKLLELDLTQTFHREEEEEYLTAEDKRLAAEEAEKEKKLREEGKYVEYRTAAQLQVARDLFPEVYGNPYTPISGNRLIGRIADTLAGAVEAIKNVLPNITGLV